MKRIFESLRGQNNNCSAENIQEELVHFHDKKPKITEITWGSVRTTEGKSSYEILLEAVPSVTGKSILDLACGNGPLLHNILLKGKPAKLVGTDLCQSDLELAKRDPALKNVSFIQAAAQKLPFNDAEFDLVFCHMAFMLFDPIEPVVQELTRILRPKGTFVAVVGGFDVQPGIFKEAMMRLGALASEEANFLKKRNWGDPRVRSEKGIGELFDPTFAFQLIHKFSFELVFEDKPENLVERFPDFFYTTELLSKEGKQKLKDEWSKLFSQHVDHEGKTRIKIPMTRFDVSR